VPISLSPGRNWALALPRRRPNAKTVFAVSELPEQTGSANVRELCAGPRPGALFVYGSHDADKLPENRVGLFDRGVGYGLRHRPSRHEAGLACFALEDLADASPKTRNRRYRLAAPPCLPWVLPTNVPGAAVVASDIRFPLRSRWPGQSCRQRHERQSACIRAVAWTSLIWPNLRPIDLIFAIFKGPYRGLHSRSGRQFGRGRSYHPVGSADPQPKTSSRPIRRRPQASWLRRELGDGPR